LLTSTQLEPRLVARTSVRAIAILLFLTFASLFIHGYHFGIEDQAIYLPAIKYNLDHTLYPHDSNLFLPQTRPTLIDEFAAWTVQLTHISVEWSVFLWHLLSVFALLLGCYRLARRCFASELARFGALALVTALFTIPVAGTALYLADQYLHPRTLATALILFALVEVLEHRWAVAAICFFFATAIHVQMAFFGGLFLVFILLPFERLTTSAASPAIFALIFTPFSNLFQRSSPEWREAMLTRSQHFLLRWKWYEWLGLIAPILVLWWFSHIGRRLKSPLIQLLSLRLLYYAAFVLVVSIITTIPARFERLTPYQPLRAFHLVYLIMFLLGGGLLAEFLLKAKLWRWLVVFIPLCAGMFLVQRDLFPDSSHIDWPGISPRNQWVQAFDWIRHNTPKDAYFALDPHYLSVDGEDYHGFRGLAERSQMADWGKDPGVVTLFPASAPGWSRQVHALDHWNQFTPADFARLETDFGVDWLIIDRHSANPTLAPLLQGQNNSIPNLICPYRNASVLVCNIR
jgi:hypothetical protein